MVDILLFTISVILVVFGILMLVFKIPLIAGLSITRKKIRLFSASLLILAGALFSMATFLRSSHPKQALLMMVIGMGVFIILIVGIQRN